MKINNDQQIVNRLVANLNDMAVGEELTEFITWNLQDAIEHALVSYSKKDIEEESFLNSYIDGEGTTQTLKLYVEDTIHVELKLQLAEDEKHIAKVDSLNILQPAMNV